MAMSGRSGEHAVHFYLDDHTLCTTATNFLLDGVRQGQQSLMVTTPGHWRMICDALHERQAADAINHATFVDAEAMLADITVAGRVDPGRFQARLDYALAGMKPPIRVFGELVTLLAHRGALDAALDLERLGHQFSEAAGVEILCAYDLHHLDAEADQVQLVAAAHHRSIPPLPSGPRNGAIVLLADDYADTRDLYQHYLESNGYRVVLADSGHEAIRAAQTWLPDLILMDIRMPDISGVDAMQTLKRDQRFAATPIVAFTANARESARAECLAAGFDEVIVKPCLPDALLKQIARFCAPAA